MEWTGAGHNKDQIWYGTQEKKLWGKYMSPIEWQTEEPTVYQIKEMGGAWTEKDKQLQWYS